MRALVLAWGLVLPGLGCRPESPPTTDGRRTPPGSGSPTTAPGGVPAGSPTTATTSTPCATPGPDRRIAGEINLNTGAYQAKIVGARPQDAFATGAGAPGDVTGDGLADLVVHAAGEVVGSDEGLAYLIPGPVSGVWDAPVVGVRIADATPGIGYDEWRATTQASVPIGDLDGDGVDDLVLGDRSGAEHGVYLLTALSGLQGGDGINLSTAYAHIEVGGGDYGMPLGFGDLTGDRIGDLVIGSPKFTIDELSEGRVYVLPGPLLPGFGDIEARDPLHIDGSTRLAEVGLNLQVSEDLDGDGLTDLVVAANTTPAEPVGEAGAVHVFLGPVVGGLATELADKTFLGGDPRDGLGQDLAALGDTDGDGLADLAMGEDDFAEPFASDGAVRVVLGPIHPGPAEPVAEAADATYHGLDEGDEAHYAWPVGDLDLDGLAELAVGARQVGVEEHSAIYLLYGPLPLGVHPVDQVADATIHSPRPDNLTAAGPGDMDGDCMPDLAISGGALNDHAPVYILQGGTW